MTLPDIASPSPPSAAGRGSPPGHPEPLREAAKALEASFLAEMLAHAGLGETSEAFGGGPGEDAFASLLVREQARLLSERGGIGLAEKLFEAMTRAEDAR